MIISMTGFGRGEAKIGDLRAEAEIRSLNSRFLEVSARLPRSLSLRENDIRELVRSKLSRGKINVTVNVVHESGEVLPVRINIPAAKAVYALLTELQNSLGIFHPITLEDVLRFSEVFEPNPAEASNDAEWQVAREALNAAIDQLWIMRRNEGAELAADLQKRMVKLRENVGQIEQLSRKRIPEERAQLQERIQQLLGDKFAIDPSRLELEIALLADRLDVTEECVRLKSHIKFFLDALHDNEPAGRRLNFLLQEMHRETNTIGVKASDAEISHIVVGMKEELEKIREQLQNIE